MSVRMKQWSIQLDVDAVLRCQGGDPVTLRTHHPRLVEIAKRAITLGEPLIHPSVYQVRLKISGIGHQKLQLENRSELTGSLISTNVAGAEEIIASIMTIGPALEALASRTLVQDPSLGLALDAVGSAAVESLSQAVCNQVDELAHEAGLYTTAPLSPGMIGWPVARGQPELFALWSDQTLNVKLTDSCMMVPSKSLSHLIGIGSQVISDQKPCDFCSSRDSCRHKKPDD